MFHSPSRNTPLFLASCLALSLAGCADRPEPAVPLPPPASVYTPTPHPADAAQVPAGQAPAGQAPAGQALPAPHHVPSNVKQLNDAFAPYQGLDVGALTTRLGPPTEQQSWAGRLLMRWRQANQQGLPCQLQAAVSPHREILFGTWDGPDFGCDDMARKIR